MSAGTCDCANNDPHGICGDAYLDAPLYAPSKQQLLDEAKERARNADSEGRS
jgi:hypothetical protein